VGRAREDAKVAPPSVDPLPLRPGGAYSPALRADPVEDEVVLKFGVPRALRQDVLQIMDRAGFVDLANRPATRADEVVLVLAGSEQFVVMGALVQAETTHHPGVEKSLHHAVEGGGVHRLAEAFSQVRDGGRASAPGEVVKDEIENAGAPHTVMAEDGDSLLHPCGGVGAGGVGVFRMLVVRVLAMRHPVVKAHPAHFAST